MDNLFIVMPIYNEAENIRDVVEDWYKYTNVSEDSRLLLVNDGSKDETSDILTELQKSYPKLLVHNKANAGHGPTVTLAYKLALENGADYVFQTDSDGQTIADEFQDFWESRSIYDFQMGQRINREDGFSRKIVSTILRINIFILYGVWLKDANVPFRLIEKSTLEKVIQKIPADYQLSNVLLSVLLKKSGAKYRLKPITFRPRQGGVNSVNFRSIFKSAIMFYKQAFAFKKAQKAQVKNKYDK